MTVAYNTLFEMKRGLGGSALPPYTPLTGEAVIALNPKYVAGMGALKADPELGLQCPVCGKWLPGNLASHASKKHKAIGGAVGLKRLLGYAPTNALVTVETHKRYHDAGVRRVKVGLFSTRTLTAAQRTGGSAHGGRGRGAENLAQSCQVQMIERFHELASELGRQPRYTDWRSKGWPQAFNKKSPVYKSWGQLVIAAGGMPYRAWKDFCKRGHSLQDDTNIYRHRDGGRSCRTCYRIYDRARKALARRGPSSIL